MKVLFVCKANVGRSQMAAALYNKLTNSNNADSAGTLVDVPNETLAERRKRRGATYAIDAIQTESVDISQNKRTQLTKNMLKPYDRIINMAEAEYTPGWLSHDPRYFYWEVADAEKGDKQSSEDVKEIIKKKIINLLDQS